MLRKLMTVCLVALFAAGIGAAGEKAWFDTNCGMCKPMADKPGLMGKMHSEQYELSNGIVAITNVPKEQLAAYRTAHDEMMKISERMAKGETVEMCGSCMALGKCLMSGVHEEYVQTTTGDVWIVTSDNPEVVTSLHEWVKRNKAEMEKTEAAEG